MKVAVGSGAPKAVAEGSGPGSGVGLVPGHVSGDDVYEEQPKVPSEHDRQLSRIGKAELPDDQQGWYRPPNSLAGGGADGSQAQEQRVTRKRKEKMASLSRHPAEVPAEVALAREEYHSNHPVKSRP